jgi:alpha-L-fucosidase 2
LDNLFDDGYFKDGSLVVNPCNSPEQTPTSFGCTHYQQLIWELFNAVEKASKFVGETDLTFLSGGSLTVLRSIFALSLSAEVKAKRAKLDRGLHIGRYGQLQGGQ